MKAKHSLIESKAQFLQITLLIFKYCMNLLQLSPWIGHINVSYKRSKMSTLYISKTTTIAKILNCLDQIKALYKQVTLLLCMQNDGQLSMISLTSPPMRRTLKFSMTSNQTIIKIWTWKGPWEQIARRAKSRICQR